MSAGAVSFQIGKAGVSHAVIEKLNMLLKHHKHIRISALPASGRNRDSIHEMARSLLKGLAVPCEYRVIGFTIALRRNKEKGKVSKKKGQK